MLFVPINVEPDALNEKSAKTLEQQQAELERFEELKRGHQRAVDCIKEGDVSAASDILLALYESDATLFRSFDGRLLLRAVMKLLLSLNTQPPEQQISMCIHGMEQFGEERYFWHRAGTLLSAATRFPEAALVYDHLFRCDSQCVSTLRALITSLKRAGMLTELVELQSRLRDADWLLVDESAFDWKGSIGDIVSPSDSSAESAALVCLTVPMRDMTWTGYAGILHALATGNYAQVFKKTPFVPDEHLILTGPCVIDTAHSQTQNTTTSLLLSSTHDYSASSMEDVQIARIVHPTDSHTTRKRTTSRRREPRGTPTIKPEVTPAELVKHMHQLLAVDETDFADTLRNSERAALQLLDKNNVTSVADEVGGDSVFAAEPLLEMIRSDNEARLSVAARIVNLMQLFFVTTTGQPYPATLAPVMLSLVQLLRDAVIPIAALQTTLQDCLAAFLLGVVELELDVKGVAVEPIELLQARALTCDSQLSAADDLRLRLLTQLHIADESQAEWTAIQQQADAIRPSTRFTRLFSPIVDGATIAAHCSAQIRNANLEAAEMLLHQKDQPEAALGQIGLAVDASPTDILDTITQSAGATRIRTCRLVATALQRLSVAVNARLLHLAVEELLATVPVFDPAVFAECLFALLSLSAEGEIPLTDSLEGRLVALLWNVYAHRQLIHNGALSVFNASLCLLLLLLVTRHETTISIDTCRWLLQWGSQERVLGCLEGRLLEQLFRLSATRPDLDTPELSSQPDPSSQSDFFSQPGMFSQPDPANRNTSCANARRIRFAYAIAFTLWRLPNIYATTDVDAGWEEWDRAPIGSREHPCPAMSSDSLFLVCRVIAALLEEVGGRSPSDAGVMQCVDWLRRRFDEIAAERASASPFRLLCLNRQHISAHLQLPLQQHCEHDTMQLTRVHFADGQFAALAPYCQLLHVRVQLAHAELQGRKKPLDTLKTLRADLKTILAVRPADAEAWKSLSVCYHDAALHHLSCEAETVTAFSAKTKRMLKRGLLALRQGLALQPDDPDAWHKLLDLADWALHPPALIARSRSETDFVCALGCSAVRRLLPRVASRDRWALLLRLEFFLRKSSVACGATERLALLQEAAVAACACFSENVYESTAVFASLVKCYSRLAKGVERGTWSNDQVRASLSVLNAALPESIRVVDSDDAESTGGLLLRHLEALSNLDRKRVFHAHYMCMARIAWRLEANHVAAISHFSHIFPFLRRTKGAASLMQIYQTDQDRPARFLVCGHRYLLQLLDFFAETDCMDSAEKCSLLVLLLRKLHYARRTVFGFSELLLRATSVYLIIALRGLQATRDTAQFATEVPAVLDIVWELMETLELEEIVVPDAVRQHVQAIEDMLQNVSTAPSTEQQDIEAPSAIV